MPVYKFNRKFIWIFWRLSSVILLPTFTFPVIQLSLLHFWLGRAFLGKYTWWSYFKEYIIPKENVFQAVPWYVTTLPPPFITSIQSELSSKHMTWNYKHPRRKCRGKLYDGLGNDFLKMTSNFKASVQQRK